MKKYYELSKVELAKLGTRKEIALAVLSKMPAINANGIGMTAAIDKGYDMIPAIDKYIQDGDLDSFKEYQEFLKIKSAEEKAKKAEDAVQKEKHAIERMNEIIKEADEFEKEYNAYCDAFEARIKERYKQLVEFYKKFDFPTLNHAYGCKEIRKWLDENIPDKSNKSVNIEIKGVLYPVCGISLNDKNRIVLHLDSYKSLLIPEKPEELDSKLSHISIVEGRKYFSINEY